MKHRTTIGFDATSLLGERSGVGTYTARLLEALIKLYPGWRYLLFSNRSLHTLEGSINGAIRTRPYFSYNRWLWMQTLLPLVIARSRADLSHFTNSSAPLWQPKPFVLTIHDASLFLHQNHHPRARLLTIGLPLPRLARKAAAVITVSKSARKDIIDTLGIAPEKVTVIYEAASAHFNPVTDQSHLVAISRKYHLPEEFILYVGTLEPRKNLSRLVRAFRHLRQAGYPHHLVLTGSLGWSMNGFMKEIESDRLRESIHVLGYVPAEDLPAIYSLATVFAFPSLYEGFGLPPLEAMACGTPVLTSNNTSLAEICGDAAYQVNPTHVGEISYGLQRLLDDPELRFSLGHKGIERAKMYSWDRAARQTMQVYRQVLGG